MSIDDYHVPGQAPRDRPALAAMAESTQRLHREVDAAAHSARVPYLHPQGPTVQVDLHGSATMLRWQEGKAERVAQHEQPWSSMPQIYARYGTEEGRKLIDALTDLEGARGVVLTDSGMSAVTLAFDALLSPKSHVLVSRQVYNKSKTYLSWLADRLDLSLSLLDEVTAESLAQGVRPDTALVFAETFTNPLLRALDPAALSAEVLDLQRERAPQLRFVVDNTIATPWGVAQPLLSWPGIQVVVASGTKALGGQDRDMWGYVAATDVPFLNRVMDLQAMRGGVIGWRVASVVSARLTEASAEHQRRCESAAQVASFLRSHPEVGEVFHPSLEGHPDREVYLRHYRRPGSLVSFRLREGDEDAARHFCDVLASTEVVRYALSFDGLLTKVNHHKTVSEFHTPDGVLRKQNIDRVVRLALGLEDAADVIACLNWALCHHRAVSAEELAGWRATRSTF